MGVVAGFTQEVNMHSAQNANHSNGLHDARSDQQPFLGLMFG